MFIDTVRFRCFKKPYKYSKLYTNSITKMRKIFLNLNEIHIKKIYFVDLALYEKKLKLVFVKKKGVCVRDCIQQFRDTTQRPVCLKRDNPGSKSENFLISWVCIKLSIRTLLHGILSFVNENLIDSLVFSKLN